MTELILPIFCFTPVLVNFADSVMLPLLLLDTTRPLVSVHVMVVGPLMGEAVLAVGQLQPAGAVIAVI